MVAHTFKPRTRTWEADFCEFEVRLVYLVSSMPAGLSLPHSETLSLIYNMPITEDATTSLFQGKKKKTNWNRMGGFLLLARFPSVRRLWRLLEEIRHQWP